MKVKYSKHMKELWQLAGKIGALAKANPKYGQVYDKLSDALDEAEAVNLVQYSEEEENENSI